MQHYPDYVVTKRLSGFAAFFLGAAAVATTTIVCGTGVICYGMRIIDRKSDGLRDLARSAIEGLPMLEKSLPPVLADCLRDERKPDYVEQLAVETRLVPDSENPDLYRPIIEVRNEGRRVVSLLAVRAVLVDKKKGPVAEWMEFGATPLATGDRCWRGPLLPGATRQIRADRLSRSPDRKLQCEIADVRVWQPESADDGPAVAPAAGRSDRDEDDDRR